jgi:thiol-disulfide isomerase/thioredoxin
MEFLGRFLRGATSAGRLPGFAGAAGWLNSDPLADGDLQGKVVLVDFWTYTCINWLRTLSHVRAWSERYGEHGLVVAGVHTPEFPFERDEGNVRWAARELGVPYPIALDPDYSVWSAFANRYWPAVYIADAEGRIRHHHFGEGGYEECERVIQRLLGDAGRAGFPGDLVAPAGDGLEAQADWENLRSPETYLNEPPTGVEPDRLRLNQWALTGDWAVESRASVLNEADGKMAFRFHARDLHLVMGPPAGGAAVPFQVRVDGEPPGEDHGVDVDEQGEGEAVEQRLYQLVRQRGSITDRTFEITFLAPGLEAYVFTFG